MTVGNNPLLFKLSPSAIEERVSPVYIEKLMLDLAALLRKFFQQKLL